MATWFITTGQNIRKLIKDGLVIRKPTVIHSRARARRQAEAKAKGRHTGYGEQQQAQSHSSSAGASGSNKQLYSTAGMLQLCVSCAGSWSSCYSFGRMVVIGVCCCCAVLQWPAVSELAVSRAVWAAHHGRGQLLAGGGHMIGFFRGWQLRVSTAAAAGAADGSTGKELKPCVCC